MSAKVHDLTQIDAVAADDEVYVVDVSGAGSARNRKGLMSQIATYLAAALLGGTAYTESDYTPTLTFATAGDQAFVGTQTGAYVRIGNLVWFTATISFTVTYTTASGALRVSLPFTAGKDAVAALRGPSNIALGTGNDMAGAGIASGQAYATLVLRNTSTNAVGNVTTAHVASGATTYSFTLSGCFRV